MSILIHNCTAVLMDGANTVLPNAFVAVEDGKLTWVGDRRPTRESTERGEYCFPDW